MPRNTSVSLGAKYNAFVDRLVASGRYESRAEVIREGLRKLEDKINREEAQRKAKTEFFEGG